MDNNINIEEMNKQELLTLLRTHISKAYAYQSIGEEYAEKEPEAFAEMSQVVNRILAL